MVDRSRFEGCLLGLALGDALGAPLEGGVLERLVWRLLGIGRGGELRCTDDTQMSLDVAESLAKCGRLDPEDLAMRFARGYRWSRGYGPAAAKVLRRIARGMPWQQANRSVYPSGSYGNGGAMRVAPLALFYASQPDELVAMARASACITHAHPAGQEGAVLVAVAVAAAAAKTSGADQDPRQTVLHACAPYGSLEPFVARLALAHGWLEGEVKATPQQVRQQLGNGIAASDSCVTAIYCAARFLREELRAMLEFVASIGGDVDTIGAMAGAVWGAANGCERLPAEVLEKLEQRQRLVDAAAALHAAASR
jgi:poly(ADP-ribose) glycohydrolase ARH3